jgi:hypothetical protein
VAQREKKSTTTAKQAMENCQKKKTFEAEATHSTQ